MMREQRWFCKLMSCRRMGAASLKASSFAANHVSGVRANEPDLLKALLKSPTVGVAICDRQLRFRAVNRFCTETSSVIWRGHHAVCAQVAAPVSETGRRITALGQFDPR
jgi:hypothetical protein